VRAVTCLEGEAVWKAGDQGRWSWELLEHVLGRSPSLNVGDIRDNCRHFVPPPGRPTFLKGPIAFLVKYRDGLRSAALLLNGPHGPAKRHFEAGLDALLLAGASRGGLLAGADSED